MKRNKRWRARWGSFLMGVCIGLLIVTPVLAAPASDLAALVSNESIGFPLPNASPLPGSILLISLMIAQAAFAPRSRMVKP